MKLVSFKQKRRFGTAIITFLVDDRSLIERLLFKPKRFGTVEYYGSCTVWHNAKTGVRCSTSMELHLANIYSFETYKKYGLD